MLALILIALIALLHVYILVVEMFLWDRPYGLKAFGNTPEKARITKVMAQNQGLYNGFLAAGLFGHCARPKRYLFHWRAFFWVAYWWLASMAA